MMKKPLSFQKTVFITQKSNISSKLHGVEGGGGWGSRVLSSNMQECKTKAVKLFFSEINIGKFCEVRI